MSKGFLKNIHKMSKLQFSILNAGFYALFVVVFRWIVDILFGKPFLLKTLFSTKNLVFFLFLFVFWFAFTWFLFYDQMKYDKEKSTLNEK